MEKGAGTMLGRVQPQGAIGGLVRQSGVSLTNSEVGQLEALMAQTKLSYPNQEIPPETLEMWAPAWMWLAIKYGLVTLKIALQEHVVTSKFFPQPADLRERLEALKPAPAKVHVPSTRREVERLAGRVSAARVSE